MSQSIENADDEITEVEREIVYERMEDIEDGNKLGDISELIERIYLIFTPKLGFVFSMLTIFQNIFMVPTHLVRYDILV